MKGGKILVADDDAAIRTVLDQALGRAGHSVRLTGNAATLWSWIARGDGDVVITDVVMPDESAFELLPRIKKIRPDLPVIVMSAQNTFMTAITATERGAYEYLPKPFDLEELLTIVGRALAEPGTRQAKRPVQPSETMPIVGRSPAMQEVYRVLARLMQTDLTVMITGESGTGKELVARALHDYGKRRKGPYVAINMAAIPRDLIEAELFGHEKGAFTGAVTRKTGRFEQAEGGTLFLDEIGDMPMEAQTRLLRVLQEGEYNTLGGTTAIPTNVRIVAATNRHLAQRIEQGMFREDLFYRLNVVPIRLPPLRERLEDIPDLVRYFLGNGSAGQVAKEYDAGAFEAMAAYSWPGNVRELENMVRRLDALHPEELVSSATVAAELAHGGHEIVEHPISNDVSLSAVIDRFVDKFFKDLGSNPPPAGLYLRMLHELERPLLAHTLAYTRGNQIRASELLGLNRNTLRKKVRDLELSVIRTPKTS
ncbi:MAG: nitrogen regulation protein NR(I) [Alphaproteobacteria bacterium]